MRLKIIQATGSEEMASFPKIFQMDSILTWNLLIGMEHENNLVELSEFSAESRSLHVTQLGF